MKSYNIILGVLLSVLLVHPVQADQNILPTVTSFSTNFISITNAQPYNTTIAVYGTNLDYLMRNDVVVKLGPYQASNITGNTMGMNLTFTLDGTQLSESYDHYPLVVTQAGTNTPLFLSDPTVIIFDPLLEPYTDQPLTNYFDAVTNPKLPSKQNIGLNVQLALDGSATTDASFMQRLQSTHTQWVREHFDFGSIMGSNSAGWLKRYDQVMLQYKTAGIHVVGMLAYGDGSDAYAAPDPARWAEFVNTVTQRYRNYVDAWEVWNEPDSSSYLHPRTIANYLPLLQTASPIIHQNDPAALVLNGAIADITHRNFIRDLYKQAGSNFDDLNVHLYYCGKYARDFNVTAFKADWAKLEKIVHKRAPNSHIWVTELGCSTGTTGVTSDFQAQYFQAITKVLLHSDNVRMTMLYNLRDRAFLQYSNPYEANFGLLYSDFTPKPVVWKWYRKLPSA